MMIEQNEKIAELRLYEGSRLVANENIKDVNYKNKNDSPINSEEEFWNPTKHDTNDSTENDTEDKVIEQMRAQFRKYYFFFYI